MSDSVPPPSEGLPPCVRMVAHNGRGAALHQSCPSQRESLLLLGEEPQGMEPSDVHVGFLVPKGLIRRKVVLTGYDDFASMNNAFAIAEKWVRGDGKMPDLRDIARRSTQ